MHSAVSALTSACILHKLWPDYDYTTKKNIIDYDDDVFAVAYRSIMCSTCHVGLLGQRKAIDFSFNMSSG